MPLARAAALVAVWSLAFATLVRAYTVDVLHVSQDARAGWALPICAAGFLIGHVLARAVGTRTGAPPLGPLRHGALLVLLAACVQGMAHVAPETTAEALMREVPPSLAFVHPMIALLAPPVLRSLARRIDAADQVLLLALFTTVQSGALFFLDGAAALGLAVAAALAQLGAGARSPRRSPLALAVVAVAAGILGGTLVGPDEAFARPAFRHVLAASLLLLSIALRPRDVAGWRSILAAPVVAAVVVAVAEVAVTVDLGLRFSFPAAFDTRLILFRQHPNFLAPLFAVSALLALGHAASRGRGRWAAALAAALLAYATWRTDSNTGRAALAVGLAAFVLVPLARQLVARVGGRRVALGAALSAAVLGAGGAAAVFLQKDVAARAVSLLERGEKSLDYRVDAWRNAVAVAAEHPLLGIGPRTFLLRSEFPPQSRFANENEIPHPHNAYLYVAQAGGVLAFLAFLVWLALLGARLVRRAVGEALPGALVAGVAGALAAQLFASLLDLGLALDTVVPWPVFVVTGLLLARDSRGRPRLLPGVTGLLVLGLAAVFVADVWRPVRAETLVRRAAVHGTQLDRTSHVEELRRLMCDELRAALTLDPLARGAAEQLAKTLAELGKGADLDEAREVLVEAARRAPDDGETWSRLGRFLLDLGRLEQAWFALSYGDRGVRGAKDPIGDRARVIVALARANRLRDAHDALVTAIQNDHETLDRLEFEPDRNGLLKLVVDGERRDVNLRDALDELAESYRESERAGDVVGRKRWLDLFHAYFQAGFLNRAEGILDFVAEHVPEIEAHSVAWDRGRLARAEGELEVAAGLFREAIALAPLEVPVYRDALRAVEAEVAGEAAGEAAGNPADGADAAAPSMIARESLGDLIEIRTAYRPHLDELASALEERGEPARAAGVLAAMLLFVDDPIGRARVRVREAELRVEAGDDGGALLCLDDALRCLWSRRHHRRAQMLMDDGRALPIAVARAELSAWRRAGLDDDAAVDAALGRPHARAFRRASILYRLGLFEALERWPALLEEAELALLQDEDDVAAQEAKRTALGRLGRVHQLARFERAIELEPSALEGRAEGAP